MNIVIKRAHKRSCAAIWNRKDYIKEVEAELSYQNVCKNVEFEENTLAEFVGKNNQFFKSLKKDGKISEKRASVFYKQIQKKVSIEEM